MKKLFFVFLLLPSLLVGSFTCEQMSLECINEPTDHMNPLSKVGDKHIKNLAAFIVSKRSVRTLHGYFARSVKPAKKLIKGFFFHADFHKKQLIDLKQCLKELLELSRIGTPLLVKSGFLMLSNPDVQTYIQSLDDLDQEKIFVSLDGVKVNEVYVDIDDVQEYVKEKDALLYAQMQDVIDKGQQFVERWQEFILSLFDYTVARYALRKDPLVEHLQSFKTGMIWHHWAPTVGLLVKGWWKSRKFLGKNVDIDDALVRLIKEMNNNALAERAVLEKEIIASMQENFVTYGKIINDVIDERLARF